MAKTNRLKTGNPYDEDLRGFLLVLYFQLRHIHFLAKTRHSVRHKIGCGFNKCKKTRPCASGRAETRELLHFFLDLRKGIV